MSDALAEVPAAISMSGLPAALIVAAAVTALVALGMAMAALHRRSGLTLVKSGASLFVGLAVVGIAVLGVVAVSPSSAHATPDDDPPTASVEESQLVTDLQLPTLAYEG
jgi:hypothetical protein